MNLLSFFSLLVFFIYFVAGIYILHNDRKSASNQSLLLLTAAIALYALSYTFYYIAPTKESARMWFKISSVGWTLFPALLLNYVFVLTKVNLHYRNWIVQPLIFLVAFPFLFRSLFHSLYADDFIWNGSFWVFVPIFSSPWLWLFLSYTLLYASLSILLLFRWKKQATLHKVKIHARLILFTTGISFLLSLITIFINPIFGANYLPELIHFTCLPGILSYSYAIIQYKETHIHPELAADVMVIKMNDLAFLVDPLGKISFANNSAKDTLGYPLEEMIDRPVQDFTEKAIHFPWQDMADQQNLTDSTRDIQMLTIKGETIPVKMNISAITDQFSDIAGFLLIAHDQRMELKLEQEIEERRMTQYDLIKAKEKAEESDRLKSVFLSNISHELRTPLNGILGFTEILKMDLKDDSFVEIANHIDRSGNRLLGTLNSIIDLSLIETNKSELDKKLVNIAELIEVGKNLYEDYAKSKNIKLSTLIHNQHIIARTDQQLLRHVISNLLDNAIKYTDEGSVELSLEQISSGHRNWALIKVKDTGIGIENTDFSKIFERFRQSSEGQSRAYEGMGIGLSICKHFVELLDGEISVESELEKGSIFYVKIPSLGDQSQSEPEVPMEKGESNFSKPRHSAMKACILIVENEKTNREYMKYILAEFYNVDTTSNGIKALEMISKNQYEMIFMDVNLDKEISGIEAMRKIRKQEYYNTIPIAVVTSNVLKTDKEKFLNSGFTHYLAKPFKRDGLLNITKEMQLLLKQNQA